MSTGLNRAEKLPAAIVMATSVAQVDAKVDHVHGMVQDLIAQMGAVSLPSFKDAFGEGEAFRKLQMDVAAVRDELANTQRSLLMTEWKDAPTSGKFTA